MNAVSFASYIAQWSASTNGIKGQLLIKENNDSNSIFSIFNITGAVVNNTTYYDIPVSYVVGTIPSNSDTLAVDFYRVGDIGSNGTSGTSGTNGTSGTSSNGTSGTSGSNGTSGTSSNGTSGTSGSNGTSGTSSNGTSGTSGSNGTSGTSSNGTSGTSGTNGTSGTSSNGTSGTSGSNGTSGTQGDKGGMRYLFDTTTSAGVGSNGSLRFDNATIGSISHAYVNKVDINNVSFATYIAQWSASTNSVKGYLLVKENANSNSVFAVFSITGAVVNNTGYYDVPVTNVSGSLPSNNDQLVIEFIRSGDAGTSGTNGTSGTSSNGTSGTSGTNGTSGTSSNGTSGTSGTGTVTSVSGTANQIGVASGTTAPVISIVSSAILPGSPTVQTPGTSAGSIVTIDGTQTLTAKTVTDGVNTVSTPGTLSLGYLGIPQNSKSAAYTMVLADAGTHIYHPSADTTARTWTIPANSSVAYPIDTTITFINDVSAGVITIAITSDTLVFATTGGTGSRTLAAPGIATAIKVGTTRWMISGIGLT